MHGLNPRQCNSASTLSGCIEINISKVIIALPTKNNVAEAFEKTLTGDFSCVNTMLGFDTEILLPNYSHAHFNKMIIDQGFKSYRKQDLKVRYKLQLYGEKKYFDRRVILKIFKLDKNNQYDYAMTKPLPTGCLKQREKYQPGEGSIFYWKVSIQMIKLDTYSL